MKPRWKFIAARIWAMLFATFLVLLEIYPSRPNSLLGWIVLLLLASPAMFLVDYFGKHLVEPEFLVDRGPIVRIGFAVLLFSVLIAVVLIAIDYLPQYLEPWGS